jgi:glycerol-1-phosphatase
VSRWLAESAGFSSNSALLDEHDALLLDLDGVVLLGTAAIPAALEPVRVARGAGLAVVFVTNNASRVAAQVAVELTAAGVPATADDVVGAAEAAGTLLAEYVPAGGAVLVTGGEGLRSQVRALGLRITEHADEAEAVLQGYAPDLTYRQLAEAALAVRRGIPWIAANLDATLPTERGLVPGNGSLVAMVAHATGRRPVVAGKPGTALHDEAVRRAQASRPLVVGDRLDTDIEGANAAAVPSLLVLTGVTDVAELAAAPPEQRPTYLAADLGGVLVAHPSVEVTEGRSARCRDAAVRLDDDRVVTVDDKRGPDGIDVLRAAVALAWATADATGSLPALEQRP